MRKRTFAALMLVGTMVMGLLTGCHGAKESKAFEIPEDFDTSKNYEITFWAKNDTNKTQTNIYNKTIKAFEELYPNITVNMRLYTDYGKIYNDVITNIATDTTPNVCITYPDHIATYMTGQDTVVALDTLLKDRKYGLGGSEVKFDSPTFKEMIGSFMEECKLDGYYYAIPYMRSTEACYINKDYVEALGYTVPDVLTWDFIWEVSEAATAKNDDGTYKINGQKVMIPFIYKSTDNMMISMLKQQNAGYSDANGNIDIFNDATKEILYTVSSHVKTKAFSTFKISSYPANFLNAGQCIFAIDSTAGSTWMGSNAPLLDISESDLVKFETVVRPIPQYDINNPKMISQGPSICIFNKEDAGEVMASWLFAQYLLTNDVQVAYAKTEGYVPVTSKAQNSEEYQDYLARRGEDNTTYYDVKIDATKLLLEHTQDTFVTDVFNGSTSLRDAAGQMIEDVAKSTTRKQKIDEAYMSKLFKDITALYRLDQIVVKDGVANRNLGPLPSTAVAMLVIIGVAWIGIAVFFVLGQIKKFKAKNK